MRICSGTLRTRSAAPHHEQRADRGRQGSQGRQAGQTGVSQRILTNGYIQTGGSHWARELPNSGLRCSVGSMSTIAEIESAIAALPPGEREALEARWLARRFGLGSLGADERKELLASLDYAEREIDDGKGLSADELRRSVRTWVGK